jgi:hypothetical protein
MRLSTTYPSRRADGRSSCAACERRALPDAFHFAWLAVYSLTLCGQMRGLALNGPPRLSNNSNPCRGSPQDRRPLAGAALGHRRRVRPSLPVVRGSRALI